MKKIKKAFLGITALLAAFSISAMCACTPGSNTENNGGNNSGGNISGGNTQAITAASVLKAYANQTVTGATLEYTLIGDTSAKAYLCDEEGNKLPNAEEHSSRSKSTEQASAAMAVDGSDLKIDLELSSKNERYDADGEAALQDYRYMFVRGGHIFTHEAKAAVTDFADVTLTYDGSMTDGMPEGYQAILAGLNTEVGSATSLPLNLILGLADKYNGASYANGVLTVDFNKVTYNLYNDVLAVIEGLDENTTVGSLLSSAPVKNLLQSLTYGMDAKEIYDSVVAQLGGDNAPAEIKAILKVLPQPAEGDGVYEYLVKVVSSKEFTGFVVSMLTQGQVGSMIAPFSEFKLADIFALLGKINGGSQSPKLGGSQTSADASGNARMTPAPVTMEEIKGIVKATLDKTVKVTEDKFTLTFGATVVEAENISVGFNVNDKSEVSGIALTGNSKVAAKSFNGIDGGDGSVMNFAVDSVTQLSLDYKFKFFAEAPALKNIDKCKAVGDATAEQVAAGGTFYSDVLDETYIPVKVRAVVNPQGSQNLISELRLLDKDGVAVGEYDQATQSVKYEDWNISVSEMEVTEHGVEFEIVCETENGLFSIYRTAKSVCEVADIIKRA